uniref:Uncharacterized protein n=1 Tax=Cacopsylla melanoneura TaxID=428564 RepID=A0A8D8VST4_9HEMI
MWWSLVQYGNVPVTNEKRSGKMQFLKSGVKMKPQKVPQKTKRKKIEKSKSQKRTTGTAHDPTYPGDRVDIGNEECTGEGKVEGIISGLRMYRLRFGEQSAK